MITDEMLAEAANALNAAILERLPPLEECTHIFSARFKRKMRRIILRGNHPILFRLARSAAMFILVLILSFTALLAVSPTVRASVIAWIKEKLTSYSAYSYHGEADSSDDDYSYELGYLPEGYKLVQRIEQIGETILIYENDATKELIYFAYSREGENLKYYIQDFEYQEYNLTFRTGTGTYFEIKNEEGANALVCFNSDKKTFFLVSGHFEKDDLIKFYENIKIF